MISAPPIAIHFKLSFVNSVPAFRVFFFTAEGLVAVGLGEGVAIFLIWGCNIRYLGRKNQEAKLQEPNVPGVRDGLRYGLQQFKLL